MELKDAQSENLWKGMDEMCKENCQCGCAKKSFDFEDLKPGDKIVLRNKNELVYVGCSGVSSRPYIAQGTSGTILAFDRNGLINNLSMGEEWGVLGKKPTRVRVERWVIFHKQSGRHHSIRENKEEALSFCQIYPLYCPALLTGEYEV